VQLREALWLNGVYFHDDEDRLERVEALRPSGFHHNLALCAGRDLTSVYLDFSTQIVKPVTDDPTLVAAQGMSSSHAV
jgi:hypothetical protein